MICIQETFLKYEKDTMHYTIAKMWKQPRWMDKEVVVYLYNGISLSYQKELIWVGSNEVAQPRGYIEWSKSEREKQISYINVSIYLSICVYNLERWSWWTYLQDSKGDPEIKNRLVDSVGEGEGVMNWKSNIETHTLPYIK